MGALATMTVLSAALGAAAPALLPKKYTHWAAVLLFLAFGARSLYDGLSGAGGEAEKEMEEVEQELAARGGGGARAGRSSSPSRRGAGAAPPPTSPARSLLAAALPPVLAEAFTLTFLAEWGDRSQLATIGLAASANPVGVTLGGILGHAICTGAAVLGGRHLAAHIDERTVHIVGGALFLVFGVHAAWVGVDG
jgi:putative Ca2+/H+ antiporter (TMEM165/GDT1 family)